MTVEVLHLLLLVCRRDCSPQHVRFGASPRPGPSTGHTTVPYLQTAVDGDDDVIVCAHALAELYASLTALPLSPEITPGQARRLIQKNVVGRVHEIVPLGHEDYLEAIQRVTDFALTSGAVYDALHVIAAEKIEADELVTFNADDFRRMPPEGRTTLVVL